MAEFKLRLRENWREKLGLPVRTLVTCRALGAQKMPRTRWLNEAAWHRLPPHLGVCRSGAVPALSPPVTCRRGSDSSQGCRTSVTPAQAPSLPGKTAEKNGKYL